MPYEDTGSEGSMPPGKGRRKPPPLFGDRSSAGEPTQHVVNTGGRSEAEMRAEMTRLGSIWCNGNSEERESAARAFRQLTGHAIEDIVECPQSNSFQNAEDTLRSLGERWLSSTGAAKEAAAAEFARLTNGASVEQVLREQGVTHSDEAQAAESESDQQTRAALEGMGIKVGTVTNSSVEQSHDAGSSRGDKPSNKSKQIVNLIKARVKETDATEIAEIEKLLSGLTGSDWTGFEPPRILSTPPEFGPHQCLKLVGNAWFVESREQERLEATPKQHSAEVQSKPQRRPQPFVPPEVPLQRVETAPAVEADAPGVGEALGALGQAVASKIPGRGLLKAEGKPKRISRRRYPLILAVLMFFFGASSGSAGIIVGGWSVCIAWFVREWLLRKA